MKKLEELIQKLNSDIDDEVRRYIPDKLAKIGDWRSTIPLGEVMINKTESSLIRNECAESLGKQGDPSALSFLEQVIHDDDEELRRTVIWSIGQIGVSEGIELLIAAWDDPYEMSRRWIAKSLGRIENSNVNEVLIEYFMKVIETHGLHHTEKRVIDDTIRAITSQISTFSESQLKTILNTLYELTEEKLSLVTIQAITRFLQELLRISELFHEDVRAFITNFSNRNKATPLLKEYLKIYFLLRSTEELSSYLNSHEDSVKRVAHVYLTALDPQIPDPNTLSLTQREIVVEGLLLNAKVFSNTNTAHEFHQIWPLNLQENNLNLLQNIIELKVLGGMKYTEVVKIFSEPKLKSHFLHIISYFPHETTYLPILELIAEKGEKKHRQILVKSIQKLLEQDPISRDSLLSVARYIQQNDRIWHIRRDARRILSKFSK